MLVVPIVLYMATKPTTFTCTDSLFKRVSIKASTSKKLDVEVIESFDVLS